MTSIKLSQALQIINLSQGATLCCIQHFSQRKNELEHVVKKKALNI